MPAITRFKITGDCHRRFDRFKSLSEKDKNDPSLGIIILGDAGINYHLDESDDLLKDALAREYKFTIYCVRGNHEARPEDLPDIKIRVDGSVHGAVYVQDRWPQIKYFIDGETYRILDKKVIVLGGAYSVDKHIRLANKSQWFENEQLSIGEQKEILQKISYDRYCHNEFYDLILSHACPESWEPRDLFLPMVDQSTVDKTTEVFLDEVAKEACWGMWCFGHYHCDRIERPCVDQFYRDIIDLNEVYHRWDGLVFNKKATSYRTDPRFFRLQRTYAEEDFYKWYRILRPSPNSVENMNF